jgi:hypothetical protein
MLCVLVQQYNRACGPVSGGVSDVGLFDPSDFNFTQAAPVSGVAQPYSAIALRAGATAEDGAKIYPVHFNDNEAEYTPQRQNVGASVKYTHGITTQLPDISQLLTTFLQSLDAASVCCGIGVVFRLNTGRIFVMGEKFVNANAIPRFKVKLGDFDGTSGKLFEDFNGMNVAFSGDYSRPLYEFTGGWDAIEAMM